MSIQERKLMLIEQVLAISDVQLFDKVETILHHELNDAIIPMTLEEYRNGIDEALRDVAQGRVITVDQLKSEVAQWGKRS